MDFLSKTLQKQKTIYVRSIDKYNHLSVFQYTCVCCGGYANMTHQKQKRKCGHNICKYIQIYSEKYIYGFWLGNKSMNLLMQMKMCVHRLSKYTTCILPLVTDSNLFMSIELTKMQHMNFNKTPALRDHADSNLKCNA